MRYCYLRVILAGVAMGAVSGALAESPPSPDELTEHSAAEWGADAQWAAASVADDTARVRVGSASIRFETDGGFDTWLWAPVAQDGGWDLLAAGSGGLEFWVYADNPHLGFQSGSPWLRVCTGPDDYFL
ncbi:MAG: hypothetical protein ACYSVY_20215, partial [Planctomycetota bacterium]